ncbi:amino acid ABC transporter permease [Streptomyces sp. NPDC001941]|uniref:amino acid ABC transporter permease n=1 Tax=Streptomyces sp. NPDC001941 TaxID=3154659 RepID=UPI003333FC4D
MALNGAWNDIIGAAAPAAPPASMRLAGLQADGGGGGGGGGNPDLKADDAPWHQAGKTSGELKTSTSSALTDLTTANDGVAGGTAGFDSSAALTEILGTWKTRLTAVREECGRLEGALKGAGRDFGEREADTRQKMAAQAPAPKKGE